MLTAADLEVNVLDFRQRSFQFERLASLGGAEFAVFARTETESESKFRPRLVHLKLAVPLAWIRLDEASDALRISKDGLGLPMAPVESVVEVGAERPEFREQGVDWRRVDGPNGALVYAPAEFAATLLTAAGFAALGIG
ncbi:MAG TPA: hypothetical protein VML53_01315 [Thermoplasmata archaeon]|nr:hypothetical protein [Thermoplasmata archaeon]